MIFYIYGTDNYLCQEKLKEIRTGFIDKKDKGGFNVIKLYSEEISIDRFSQEVLTVPFLSEKKLIIASGLMSESSVSRKKLRDELFEFLKTKEAKLENNLLFFDVFDNDKKIPKKDKLFEFLKKQKYSWYLPALKNQAISDWLKSYCHKNKINLTLGALNELITLLDNDLLQMTNELSKLQAYKKNEPILKEDVNLLVKAKYNEDIFKLTDALAGKDKKTSLKLINDQLASGNDPLSLLGSINWQFKILLKIKSLLEINPRTSSSEIASKIRLHPFVASKNLTAVRKFDLKELIKIQNDLLEIEKRLKSGDKNSELLFDLFIINNS